MLKVEILASFQSRLSPWVKEGFSSGKFSWSIKYFFSVIVFPLNLIYRVFFAFWSSKVTELLWRSLLPFWMGDEARHFTYGCLFVQSSLWHFWWEDSTVLTKVDFLKSFLTPRTCSLVWNLWKNAGNFAALVCCGAAN